MPAVTGGQDNYLFNMEVMVTGMQRNEATYYTAAQTNFSNWRSFVNTYGA